MASRLTWLHLAESIKSEIQPHILARGLHYLADNRVTALALEGTLVTATVEGTESYSVQLDVDRFPGRSLCTCPYGDLCKHMAAVALQVLEEAGVTFDTLDDLVHGPRLQGLNRVARDLKTDEVAPVGDFRPSAALTDWARYVESQIDSLSSWGDYRGYELDRVCERLLQQTTSWPPTKRQLAAVVVRTVTMVKRLERGQGGQTPISLSYSVRSAEGEARQLESNLRQLSASAEDVSFLDEGWVGDWIAWLHARLFDQLGLVPTSMAALEWMWLYWLRLYPERLRQERVYLEQQARRLHAEGCTAREGLARVGRLQALLQILAGEEEEGLRRLSELEGADFDGAVRVLQALEQRGRWDLCGRLLRDVSALLQPGQAWAGVFAEHWMVLARHVESAQRECRDFLRAHLPTTAGQYRDYLLQHAAFVDWADYVMTAGGLDAVSSDERKWVEKRAPQVLLPILHQEVHRLVGQRTREHYRLACRRLKQLRTQYRKLKQADVWEAYIGRFTARHRRLRALMEEMEKAKVMPP